MQQSNVEILPKEKQNDTDDPKHRTKCLRILGFFQILDVKEKAAANEKLQVGGGAQVL